MSGDSGVESGVAFSSELGYSKIRLRTGGETSIKTMAKGIAIASGKHVVLRTASRAVHSSKGEAEGHDVGRPAQAV